MPDLIFIKKMVSISRTEQFKIFSNNLILNQIHLLLITIKSMDELLFVLKGDPKIIHESI